MSIDSWTAGTDPFAAQEPLFATTEALVSRPRPPRLPSRPRRPGPAAGAATAPRPLALPLRVEYRQRACRSGPAGVALGPENTMPERAFAIPPFEAKPDQILVSRRVVGAVEDFVEAEAVGELALKGFLKPIPAFNVVRLREVDR